MNKLIKINCWSCDINLNEIDGYHLVDGSPTCGDCEN
jgi:hypothetical protein